MPCFICTTCGTQYDPTDTPPPACTICTDERQYVHWDGQQWTTLEALRRSHRNEIETMESGLQRIGMRPDFAIGQHAFLVQHPGGNLLWDCVTLLDDDTLEAVHSLGGVTRIAISHPHYYSSMIEWSRAFGGVPIHLHAADRRWVARQDDAIEHWQGETLDLDDGLTLIRGGGHFEGGTMLHWAGGADGRGALLPGDIIQVVHDRRWVSFMYSFMNYIPLGPAAVRHLAAAVEPFEFERIYSPWTGRVIATEAKAAVRRSVDRYLRAIADGE